MTRPYIRNAGILISAQCGLLLVFATLSVRDALSRGDGATSAIAAFSAGCLATTVLAGALTALMPHIWMHRDENES